MNIENVKIWPHVFSITSIEESDFDKMQQWCADNCSGQWSVIAVPPYGRRVSTSDLKIHLIASSPPKYQYEIDGDSYSPASLTKKSQVFYSFQEESDAVAFKMHFHSPQEDDDYENDLKNPPF